MTNPSNIVRLHSRNGGRASVYETNQWAQFYQAGILSGTGVEADTNLNVTVGSSNAPPTVLIAETSAGYKIALDLVGAATLTLTAPASNSKIVSIVAYTDDLAIKSTDTTVTGNPSFCGLLAVSGAAAASPTAPSDADIRAAITADGAAGGQAVYVVIGKITLASTTATITDALIENFSATAGIISSGNIGFKNMKLPSATITLQNPFDSVNWPTRLTRIANIVLVSAEFVAAPSGDVVRDGVSGSIIPNGFRPSIPGVVGAVSGPALQGVTSQFEARFLPTSQNVLLHYACLAGSHRFGGSGWYLTDDAWPEE